MNNKTSTLIYTTLSCIVLGASIGGSTNSINGIISPIYFIKIMGWEEHYNIWLMSIFQGTFEGLLYGFIFAVVYATVVAIYSGTFISKTTIFSFFGQLGGIILIFWSFGGLAAVILAYLSPEFYRNTFIGVPHELITMLKYAWVGGSIWGGMLGGLLTLFAGIPIFKNKLCS